MRKSASRSCPLQGTNPLRHGPRPRNAVIGLTLCNTVTQHVHPAHMICLAGLNGQAQLFEHPYLFPIVDIMGCGVENAGFWWVLLVC